MPITVDAPDGSQVEFPDSMQPEEIEGVLSKQFPNKDKERKSLQDEMSKLRFQGFLGEQEQAALGAAENIARVAAIPATPILKLPRSQDPGVTGGLLNVGAGLAEGLSAPAYWMLPGSKPLQALTAGQIAGHIPESTVNAIQTITNPQATTAQKVEAGAAPLLEAGTAGLLSGAIRLPRRAAPESFPDVQDPREVARQATLPSQEPIAPAPKVEPEPIPQETPPVVPRGETPAEAPAVSEAVQEGVAAPPEEPAITETTTEPKVGQEPTVTPEVTEPPVAKAAAEVQNVAKQSEDVAAAKIALQVAKVERTGGQRPAKEAKSELLKRVEDAMHGSPEESAYSEREHGFVQINIPGDGDFKVPNNLKALSEIRDRVKAISTTKGTPPKLPKGSSAPEAFKLGDEEGNYSAQDVAKAESQQAKYLKALSGIKDTEPLERYFYDKNVNRDLGKDRLHPNVERLSRAISRIGSVTVGQAKGWLEARVRQAKRLAEEQQGKPISEGPGAASPQITGMGGAIPAEFDPSSGNPTSIKNARVDVERAQRGLPPAVQPARKSFGEVWDRAMARIDQDPTYPDALIDSLEKKPRALTDEEDATLLHRQIDLQNEYGKATRDLAQAYEDGRKESADSERVRVAALSDQLLRLYNIGKKVGTETGRGLNARRMLANEDFTLAKMTLDLRAAKGGQSLTPEESIQVQQAHDEVVQTQKRLEDYETGKSNVASTKEADKVIEGLAKARPTREPRTVKPPAEEIKASADSIRKKVAEGDLDISGFVRKLARAFIADGINDREALIDAVHGVLKDIIPEISRRETMDAISGYGQFKQLTKDQISVKLRGMKGEMQQLAKLEDMAKGQPPLKTGIERRTPTDAERQLIKEVNDAKNKFQIPVQDPTTQLKSALDTLKTTLKNRISDYEDRLKRGDYSSRPRREVVLDPEASRLKAEAERVKKKFQRQVQIERLKNRTQLERSADWVTKWRRGFLLSGPNTLAKLTSAALQRAIFTPAEEIIGGVVGKAIPGVSKVAPREGGLNVKAEARAISQGLTRGIADAWKTLRTGQSDLDVLYGKEALIPPSAADFFGHIHGALKAPTKRAEFARSLEKRTESAVRQGVDVTDPMVQSRLVIESYKDANRSIFLQDNRVVNAYKRGLQALEQRDKATGELPLSGKAASTAARILMPIVKVPTNIVAEAMTYATGTVTGSLRLGRAYARGIENLKPEEADLIMRQLKKGSLGAAAMLLGYFNPDVVGGYYQRGEKRKPNEPKAAAIRLYGENIPSYLLHSPLMEVMQVGATVRRVSDSKIKKTRLQQKGIGEGVYAAALGLAEDTPFLREPVEVAKAFDPREKTAFWGELSKSLVVPQALQWWANQQDKNAQGNVRRRNPQTVIQHIETGVPYLRERVPLSKRQP